MIIASAKESGLDPTTATETSFNADYENDKVC